MDLVSSVVKGNNIAELDTWLASPTQQKLDLLKSKTLYEIASSNDFMTTDADRHHVEVEAFGGEDDSGAWWGALGSKEKIIRGAYIQAVEICLASAERKRIVSYWVRGMRDRLEAYVIELDRDVVVLWLTPDVPGMNRPPRADSVEVRTESIWAVAEKERIEGYVERYEGRGYALGETRDVIGDDETAVFQVIGY